jgi:dTMP kinase
MEMDKKTELMLFMAARSQHVEELIKPSLKNGMIVLCDRFAYASVAYQGYARGMDPVFIQQLNTFSCGAVWPDITFLLDIPAEEFIVRKTNENKRFDRIESSGPELMKKVREGYLALSEQEPKRFVVLDGKKSREELEERIYKVLEPLIEVRIKKIPVF